LSGGAGYSDTALSSLFAGPSNLWSLVGASPADLEGGTLYYRRESLQGRL